MDPREFGLVKAAYSINELSDIVPIGRSKIYQAIQDGDLRAVKFGKRRVVLTPDLVEFLAGLRDGSKAA